MENYASEYAKLNPNQRAAVEYIEGPLLVIAGPGTGKTQLLSLRAANILLKTDTLAENILCLTFTEAGAQQMRQRLINIIGDDAYKITISTYHSFGSEIIRYNPSYFLKSTSLRPINDLKTDAIIRQLQKTLPFTSQFKELSAVKDIAKLISSAKKADLSPKNLELVAKDNLKFIQLISPVSQKLTDKLARVSKSSVKYFNQLLTDSPKTKLVKNIEPLSKLWNDELSQAILDYELTNKTTALTKWKSKYLTRDNANQLIAKGQTQNESLIEFCSLYSQYNQQLQASNLYDYDDMILSAISVLKNNASLRYNLQEKYLYIMLDEYQDTNQAQAELVNLLTNKQLTNGQPNIMAVGDDDQAIFAFQGAKHSNMLDFVKAYKNTKVITLQNNYRSTQNIIDLSSQLTSQIKSRLTEVLKTNPKDFQAATNRIGQINSLVFNNELEQYSWLANQLTHKTDKKIAIIAPKHQYLEKASAYLIDKGIPISYERRENILNDSKISQIITCLRLITAIKDNDNQLTDHLLATVLNYEFLKLDTKTIWQLSWQSHESHQPWLNLMLSQPKTNKLALMLIKLSANSRAYRYDFIIDQVIGLSDIVINQPKPISTRFSFIEYISKEGDNITSQLFENLITLRQKFIEFNADNNKPLMVDDFIDFIDQLNASNEKIVNDFSFVQASSQVELLSAHSAKGQEFDAVYLLSMVNEVWANNISKNNLSLPINLVHIISRADDPDDDRLRLLYVALTRAKSSLTTLSYELDENAKQVTPLKYLPLNGHRPITKNKTNLRPLWQIDTNKLNFSADLKSILIKRLEKYALSPTELNTFIDVRGAGPRDFYTQSLLKYRRPLSARVDYGIAIHNSLDWLLNSYRQSAQLPGLNQLIDEFTNNLKKRRLVEHDYLHLKDQGIKALTAYYTLNKANFSKDDYSELDFRAENILLNDVRITGKIDRLIVNPINKNIEIVDYKTGKGSKTWSSNQPKLHLYRNQLYFYKLLVEHSTTFKNYQVSGGRLDFIQADQTNQPLSLALKYETDYMYRFIKLIEAVFKHILDLNFPNVNSYKPNTTGIMQFEDDLINGKI